MEPPDRFHAIPVYDAPELEAMGLTSEARSFFDMRPELMGVYGQIHGYRVL